MLDLTLHVPFSMQWLVAPVKLFLPCCWADRHDGSRDINKIQQMRTVCIRSPIREFQTCKPLHKLGPVDIVKLRTNI